MKQPDHLIFVCQNLRGADDPRGSCMARGSRALLEQMKAERARRGLKGRLRVMGSTCLGACEAGILTLVVSRAGAAFYGRMNQARVHDLFDAVEGDGVPCAALDRHRLPPANLLDLSALAENDSSDGDGDDGE